MLPANWHDLTWLQKAHLQMWSPALWAHYTRIEADHG